MTKANIADFKSHLSVYMNKVESGETIEVCKRNVPVAIVQPVLQVKKNKTVLGCGKGSVTIHGDITEPVLDGWDMHAEDLP